MLSPKWVYVFLGICAPIMPLSFRHTATLCPLPSVPPYRFKFVLVPTLACFLHESGNLLLETRYCTEQDTLPLAVSIRSMYSIQHMSADGVNMRFTREQSPFQALRHRPIIFCVAGEQLRARPNSKPDRQINYTKYSVQCSVLCFANDFTLYIRYWLNISPGTK